jgi:hypothetical protein
MEDGNESMKQKQQVGLQFCMTPEEWINTGSF